MASLKTTTTLILAETEAVEIMQIILIVSARVKMEAKEDLR
jgi:hypothetical protein